MEDKVYMEWRVGFVDDINGECSNNIRATVPGAVQLDWANAHGYPPYWYGDNYKQYRWMEEKFFVYSSETIFNCKKYERAILLFKGIDYKYIIKINDTIIRQDEGMFTPIEIDITAYANKPTKIEVIVFPPPKATREDDRTQARESCKPAVSYGWDWHPRLIPIGIWDEAYIKIVPENYIKKCKVSYEINNELTKVNLELDIDINGTSEAKIELFDNNFDIVLDKNIYLLNGNNSIKVELENPKVWWPLGYGTPNIYTIKVSTLQDNIWCVQAVKKIGFRKIKLVMNEGEWEKPKDFPKTRSTAPITIELNNKKIFAKGSNWVNPEIFPGIINRDTYMRLITLVKDANMNMLRVWGGGITNKDSFYELCDEYGIMVWQEFPLACNNYPDKDKYLKILDKESESIIKRLSEHPSVVIWCGGNELYNNWSGMTDQSLALRLLNMNCYKYDRNTPFLMTSPLYGMAHGHYHTVNNNDKEFLEILTKCENTAYTEFGCPGPSSTEYIKTFMSENDYNNCRPNTVWEDHHAFNAWAPEDTWLRKSEAEYFFGVYEDVDDLIEKCTLIQSISYKAMFEEMRRQWPRCSMALNWCLNEPWPTAANNSIINWPDIPKKCYYFIKDALRHQMVSIKVSKLLWVCGEEFSAEIWILNDSLSILKANTVKLYIDIDGCKEELLRWSYKDIIAQTNVKGPTVNIILPKSKSKTFNIYTESEEDKSINSHYQYILKHKEFLKETRKLTNV